MLRLAGVVILGFCVLPAILWSQAVPSQPQSSGLRTTFPNVRGLSQDYRIGAGDALEIQVVDTPELNQTLTVSAAGGINFLGLGAIPVLDLTAAELETRIAAALKLKKLVKEPQVLVFIKEYRAKRIFLMGEFASPGEFVMSQNLTVMDAILLAGGLGPSPDDHAYLHRHFVIGNDKPPSAALIANPEVAQEGTEIIKINLKPMLEGRAPEPDPLLKEGDFLIVSRKLVDSFYVLGDVTNPSNFDIPEGQTITVSRAIAQAGGPTFTAKPSNTIIARRSPGGTRQDIKVDYSAILKGKKPDIAVKPNDVIYVPSGKLPMLREQYVTRSNLYVEGTVFRIGRYYQLPEEGR